MAKVTATVNGQLIADSDSTIMVEGNHYFPHDSVNFDYLTPTDHTTVCHWKGEANYFTIKVGDEVFDNSAWTYHEPKSEAAKELKDYVAFYSDRVLVEEK